MIPNTLPCMYYLKKHKKVKLDRYLRLKINTYNILYYILIKCVHWVLSINTVLF